MRNISVIYKQSNDYHPILEYIYYSQILINTILVWANFFTTNQDIFSSIFLTLLNLGGIFVIHPKHDISIINTYFQAIFQIISNYLSFNYFILLTQDFLPWNTSLGLVLTSIVFLLMYIPTSIIIWPHIFGYISKLLMSFLLIITIMSSFSFVITKTILNNNTIAHLLSTTQVLDAVVLFITFSIIMKNWGFDLPSYKLAHKTSPRILIALFVICVYFLFKNSFGAGSNYFKTFYMFDFSGIHITLKYIFSGLEAGIAEETIFRYVFLTFLLMYFKNFKYKIFYSALINSTVFSLIHLLNLTSGQDIQNTLIQALGAFGIGMLFSAIYLYTGLFIWPVIMHSLIDILSFSQQGMIMSGKVTIDYVLGMILLVLFYLAVSLYLLKETRIREQNLWFN